MGAVRKADATWQSQIYVPPGWPREVRPPGAPDWETSAVAYLLDCCPSQYRGHLVLRRHPVVLARFAAEHVEGQITASRDGLASVRASLADYVEPEVIQSASEAWQAESAQLIRVRRAIALIEEALRGRIFIRKL